MGDRTPAPANPDLERGILARVVMQPGAFESWVAAGVQGRFFYQTRHQYIWTAAERLAAIGQPIDLLSLSTELHRLGYQDEAKPAYLSALTDGVPALSRDATERRSYTRHHARELRRMWSMRQLRDDIEKLEGELDGSNPDPEYLEDRIELMRERLLDTSSEDDGEPGTAYRAVLRDAQRGQQGARLGLESIDEHLGGIRPGEVCLTLARGGVAKTVILGRACADTLALGWGCVFFSLEMSLAAIFERHYRMAAELDQWHYQQQKFNNQIDHELWARYAEHLALHEGLYTLPEIERRIIQAKNDRLGRLPGLLVCIDYFQLIPGHDNKTAYEKASLLAKDIKKLAKRQQVAMLIAVQVSREAGGDGSRRLTIGAARDSGQIEEAADVAIGLRRFDTSNLYSEEVRHRYNARIFAEELKRRGGDKLTREFAYAVDYRGFKLQEEPHLKPPEEHGDPLATAQRRRGR